MGKATAAMQSAALIRRETRTEQYDYDPTETPTPPPSREPTYNIKNCPPYCPRPRSRLSALAQRNLRASDGGSREWFRPPSVNEARPGMAQDELKMTREVADDVKKGDTAAFTVFDQVLSKEIPP